METKNLELSATGSHEGTYEENLVENSMVPGANEEQPVVSDEQTASVETETADKYGIAFRNIVVGACWCIGGLVVTAVSYNAGKNTGGTYIVAWGAVVFGGYQFLKGLGQLIS